MGRERTFPGLFPAQHHYLVYNYIVRHYIWCVKGKLEELTETDDFYRRYAGKNMEGERRRKDHHAKQASRGPRSVIPQKGFTFPGAPMGEQRAPRAAVEVPAPFRGAAMAMG